MLRTREVFFVAIFFLTFKCLNSEREQFVDTSRANSNPVINSSSIKIPSSTSNGSIAHESDNRREDTILNIETCPAKHISESDSEEEFIMEAEITALTLNCWGIRYISKDRVARMTAIAEELASGKYDFVFLQEVWTTEDYERIKVRTGNVLPYSHYFFSGVIGAGICIFSKSPIKSAFFHQWAVNGYIHKIQHGDWFGGKGIGMVEVDHKGLRINLYTTHLHAEYDRENDEYIAHRVTQAFDTAQFISVTSRHADVVIVGGDLNTEPGDLAYRIIIHTADLRDAFDQAEKRTPAIETLNTCETARNSYSSPVSLKQYPYGKRIDYIIYKGGQNVRVSALTLETPWPDRVPGQPFSYSDHEAVVTRMRINKSNVRGAPPPPLNEAKKEALEESVEICDQALRHLQSTQTMYYVLALAMFVIFSMTASLELQGLLSPIVPVLRLVVIFILFFACFMSIIWHRMEVHGILAGKLGMLIELGKPIRPETEILPENNALLNGVGGGGDTWTAVDPTDCLP